MHARAVVNDWRGRFSRGSSPSSTGVRVTPSFLSPLLVHNHHVITSLLHRRESVLYHPSNPAQSLAHRFRWKMLHSSKSATTVTNCINVRRSSSNVGRVLLTVANCHPVHNHRVIILFGLLLPSNSESFERRLHLKSILPHLKSILPQLKTSACRAGYCML